MEDAIVASPPPPASASPSSSLGSSENNKSSSGRRFCGACSRPARVCICSALPSTPIVTAWRVLVLQTRAESKASIGSARLLPLVLHRAVVEVVGGAQSIASALLNTGECVLLYPGRDSIALSEHALARGRSEPTTLRGACDRTLVVLDGSWEGAQRMLSKSDILRDLSRVKLPESATEALPPLFVARRPPANVPGARSTAEAVAVALDVLESDDATGPWARSSVGDAIRDAVCAASDAQMQFVRGGNRDETGAVGEAGASGQNRTKVRLGRKFGVSAPGNV